MYKITTGSFNKKQEDFYQYSCALTIVSFDKETYSNKKDIKKQYLASLYKKTGVAIDFSDPDTQQENDDEFFYQVKPIYKEPLETFTHKLKDLGITLHYHMNRFKLSKQEDISKLQTKLTSLNE